jgi:hypothetical protein
MDALARRMAPEGLVVLAISQDADSSVYLRFIRKRRLGFLSNPCNANPAASAAGIP